MKKQFKLGVIGCGFEAQTILRGVVLSDFLSEKKIIVGDFNEDNFGFFNSIGIRSTTDIKFIAENSDFLVLAVNPRDFDSLAKKIGGSKPEKIISATTGIKKNTIKNMFGLHAVKVARGVINLPCTIGSGVCGVDMTDFNNSLDDIEFVSNIFNCIGTVLSTDESKLDAVTGLGGGGPAYAFIFIDSLISAGIKCGLSKNEAKILAVQSVIGAAEMVERDEQSVPELLVQACGKGSAAIEAVKVLEQNNFRGTISDAVTACTEKAKEISSK